MTLTTLEATARTALEAAIPADLKNYPQWSVWRLEQVNGGRATKVPYNARTGRRASVSDPKTWSTFKQARKVAARYDGLGFVLTAHDPFCGLDLDGCRDPETGAIAPWAEEIIESLDSYTEISPSGTGIRIFTNGTLPPGWRNRGSVEMYDRGRYLTVTGNQLPGTAGTIEERTDAITALHARLSAGSADAPSGGQPLPERWAKMLGHGYAAAVAHWDGRAGGHQDQSGSGKDMKLAHFARKLGFNPEEVAAILRGAAYEVQGGRPADYIRRTVERAFSGKGTRKAPAGEGYGALWAKVVTSGKWASLPDPQKAVYIPLVVLAMRPSGIVRAGREKLAKLAGLSAEKVSRATTGLVGAGLIRKRPGPVGVNYWVLTPADFPADLTCTPGTATQVSRISPPTVPESPTASESPTIYLPKRHTGQSEGYPRNRQTCASGHEVREEALRGPGSLGVGGGSERGRGPATVPSQRHIWRMLQDGTRIVYQKHADGSEVEVGRTLPDPERETKA